MKSIQFAYDTEKAMFLGPLQLEALHEERRASEKLVSGRLTLLCDGHPGGDVIFYYNAGYRLAEKHGQFSWRSHLW